MTAVFINEIMMYVFSQSLFSPKNNPQEVKHG